MELTGLAVTILVFVTGFFALALLAVSVVLGKTCWLLTLELRKSWRMVGSLSENPRGLAAASLDANVDLAEQRNGAPGVRSALREERLAGG